MAIPAKKLHALVQESKKARLGKHAPPSDDGDDDMDDEGLGEDDGGDGKKKAKQPDMNAIVAKAAQDAQSGDVDEDLQEMLDEYDPDEDEAPPSWIDEDDEHLWDKAKGAVKQKWADYDSPWTVVALAYKALGGRIEGDDDDGHEEPDGDEGDGGHEHGGDGDE